MKIKRVLALLLAIFVCVGCMSVTAFADTEDAVELVIGENTVAVPYEGLYVCFTPEADGYYSIAIDEDVGFCVLEDAESEYDGDTEYYILEAGVTYIGWIISWSEEDIELIATVSYSEDVQIPDSVELFEGENIVAVPYEGVEIYFIPETAGYYCFTVNDELGWCFLYEADSVTVGDVDYYMLEAGVAYEGWLFNWEDEDLEFTVTVAQSEEGAVPEPVAIALNKLPDDTVFLSTAVDMLWEDSLLGGLELTVTWADGTESVWKFDEDGSYIEGWYVYYETVYGDDPTQAQVIVGISGTEIPTVEWDLTLLDIEPESMALVDDSPLQIVENSCGIDIAKLGELLGDDSLTGWYYLPFSAYTRQVEITFSDGSTVQAYPGEMVYGLEVYVEDSQTMEPWTKDGLNQVAYFYDELEAILDVEIVDSPVESIELITPPDSTFCMYDDYSFVNKDGEEVTGFRLFLQGMTLAVHYKDGTVETVGEEDIQWIEVSGEEYPMINGYPLGVVDGLWSVLFGEFEVPCELEASIEYMGASAPYTIYFVEEFEGSEDVELPEDSDTSEDENTDTPEDENTDTPEDENTDTSDGVENEEKEPEVEEIPKTGDISVAVSVSAAVLAVLCGAAVISEKKKLF